MSSVTPAPQPVRVLMVCLGNICRSPTAHGVLEFLIQQRGLAAQFEVDSCGTANYHSGESPDPRTRRAARQRGYNLESQRARQLNNQDFARFDYLLAMDEDNLREMRRRCPPEHQHKLRLFLDWSDGPYKEVPDPYYAGPEGFEQVLDLVEETADRLLNALITDHRESSDRSRESAS